MDHSAHPAHSGGSMGGIAMLRCNGEPVSERQGDLKGHLIPGLILVFWATHWVLGMCWRWHKAALDGAGWRSRSFETPALYFSALVRAGPPSRPPTPTKTEYKPFPLESLIKVIIATGLVFAQLFMGGYKYLVCGAYVGDDVVRLQRIETSHLNSWSHASLNIGFLCSGLIELTAYTLDYDLPDGLYQAFLSLGFMVQYILLSMHEKHGILDTTVHKLIGACALSGGVFAAAEAVAPHLLVLSLGRAASQMLQGTWLIQTGFVLFGGSAMWDDKYNGMEDAAPGMFAPIVFVWHVVGVSLYMFYCWVGMGVLVRVSEGLASCCTGGKTVQYMAVHADTHAMQYGSQQYNEKSGLLSDVSVHIYSADGGVRTASASGGGAGGAVPGQQHMQYMQYPATPAAYTADSGPRRVTLAAEMATL